MAYRILFTAEAKKDIECLDAAVRKRLHKKLLQIADLDDIQPLIKRLINDTAGQYRLRVGDYRSIFDLDRKTLYLLRVRHRKDVYR